MTDDLIRCYRVLELEPGASPEAVKQAYRELVKVWHPDRFPNDPKLQKKGNEKIKLLNAAYEKLKAQAEAEVKQREEARVRAEEIRRAEEQARRQEEARQHPDSVRSDNAVLPHLEGVIPLTLSIEMDDGRATIVFKRNTIIPARASLILASATGPTFGINVFCGENPDTAKNHLFGRYVIEGIKPTGEGKTQTNVIFELDANTILQVSAYDVCTGKPQNVRIEGSCRGPSIEEFEALLNATARLCTPPEILPSGTRRDQSPSHTVRKVVFWTVFLFVMSYLVVAAVYQVLQPLPGDETIPKTPHAQPKGDIFDEIAASLDGEKIRGMNPFADLIPTSNLISAARSGDLEAQYNLGCQHSRQGNHAEALRWITSSAEKGYAVAQNTLGVMYFESKGLPPHYYAEGIKWLRRAAEQGYAIAQANLAAHYATGEGVRQDHKEAFKLYRQAAEKGNAQGQYGLGLMYGNGEGVPQNPAVAIRWFLLAANQGEVDAQNELGIRFASGKGVAIDRPEAYKWFKLASEQGSKSAQRNLESLKYEMTSPAMADGENRAALFRPRQ